MNLSFSGTGRVRLDIFLHQRFPQFSRSYLQRYIKQGKVLVNDQLAAVHHWLKDGDRIQLPDDGPAPRSLESPSSISGAMVTEPEGKNQEPTIVHKNDHWAVINKPAGLLMHATGRAEQRTLVHWLVNCFPQVAGVGEPARPGIVHRLDKEVGGLVIVALDQSTYQYLKELFKKHTITKKYLALVHGRVAPEEGSIDRPLERNKQSGRMIAQTGRPSGKAALTRYRVRQRWRNYTLLEVEIVTGRTHQIRTHFLAIGHSIVGDRLYQTRQLKKRHQTLELPRPFLFAYQLAFMAPDGQRQSFTLPLPAHLQSFLDSLS